MHLIPIVPVGQPGLAVIMAAFLIFGGALILARRRSDKGGEIGAKRDRTSMAGIVTQAFGIFTVGVGPIAAVLGSASSQAIGQAAVIALLMTGAIGLFFASSRAMGQNWSIVARMRADHSLVTSGPFAHIRHPIYVALFLFMLAMAVAFGHYAGLILGIPLYAIGTIMRVRIEERLLRAQFGTAYDAYAARVRRFVPSLF